MSNSFSKQKLQMIIQHGILYKTSFMLRVFAFTGILFISYGQVSSQRNIDIEEIEADLDKMELDFYIPTENTFKFQKLRLSEFFEYDSRMKAKSNEMEILIALHPDGEDDATTYFPHIEFQRLLANLSPNDDDQNILVVGWREQRLKERNADWGAEAYFTPREEITKFPHLKLVAFFKEGKGMVVMAYCFDKLVDSLPQLISFFEI